jgi:cell division septum initiation protein DivIVA
MGAFRVLSLFFNKRGKKEPERKPRGAAARPAAASAPVPRPPAARRQAPDDPERPASARTAGGAETARADAEVGRPQAVDAPPSKPIAAPQALGVELDTALGVALSSPEPAGVDPGASGGSDQDQAAVRELFAEIAANEARAVKGFLLELRRGLAPKTWIEVCRPVLATLIEGAKSLGLTDVADRVMDLDQAIAHALETDGESVGGEARERILGAYEEATRALPGAFALGEQQGKRDGLILHALLKQIPDVGHVTFERLYGAGLTTLDTLFLATKEDLTATTGIPLWLAERICEKLQEHRRQLDRARRDPEQLRPQHQRLARLVAELRAQHEAYERASEEEWRNPALAEDKRQHRQARQTCALEIEVALAEMGELELVEEIQKMPFASRVERLEAFVGHPAEALPVEVLAASPARTPIVAHKPAGR